MFKKRSLALGVIGGSAALAWVAACSSTDTSGAASGASERSGSSSGSAVSGTTGQSGSATIAPPRGGITDASSDARSGGLLVDDMSVVQRGTQTRLRVPEGESAGSYYGYSDRDAAVSNYLGLMSLVTGTSQLADLPITPSATTTDGATIVGDICFGGRVVSYAGLGMTFAYGNAPDASPESGISSAVPFDASRYSGMSFYILVDASDAAVDSLRVGIPDTQTADPAAWPAAKCDVDGGVCDDDFGEPISYTPGIWSRVSFAWSDLQTVGFGSPTFAAIDPGHLIGMKWQANGAGPDAGAETFNFCISDISFLP